MYYRKYSLFIQCIIVNTEFLAIFHAIFFVLQRLRQWVQIYARQLAQPKLLYITIQYITIILFLFLRLAVALLYTQIYLFIPTDQSLPNFCPLVIPTGAATIWNITVRSGYPRYY